MKRYIIELFPGSKGNLANCPQKCPHCPMSERGEENRTAALKLSERTRRTYNKLQDLLNQTDEKFSVSFASNVLETDFSSYPEVFGNLHAVSFHAGSVRDYPNRSKLIASLENATGFLSSSCSVSDENLSPTVRFCFEDNLADLLLSEDHLLPLIGEFLAGLYAFEEQSIPSEFRRYHLAFSGNNVQPTIYDRALDAQPFLFLALKKGVEMNRRILRKYERDDDEHVTSFSTEEYSSGTMVGIIYDVLNNVDRFSIGCRYIKDVPNMGKITEPINPKGISLYPHKVLIGHNSKGINLKDGWITYDDFDLLLEKSKSSRKPLHEIIIENI